MGQVSPEQAMHVLSTIIATPAQEYLIVPRDELRVHLPAAALNEKFCVKVAELVTRKFKLGGQYDWVVCYIPEIYCFVAVSEAHARYLSRETARKLSRA